MCLIINADDFGKNESVNKAVRECFEKKLIQRTTLMVNMPAADEAVAIAKAAGFSDRVGIHLNLTEGRPLTGEIRNNPLLCDEYGNFHAGFQKTTKYRLYMDELTIGQIREELDAQLCKYRTYGLTLNHIDSHHHVHTNYPILRALKPLAPKYGFSSVRLSRNLYHGGSLPMRLYKSLYNHAIRKLCKTGTDYFGSYQDMIAFFSVPQNEGADRKDALARLDRFLAGHSLEIMVHPMYDASGVLLDTDIPMEREKELLHA
ncbi:MAG TPA: ChbG/HpnK family deacetylase [Lachnospiraceae bacterium]|nr:ChbG/HpnK family deacetylase [Lachnospiraceae bacterium]